MATDTTTLPVERRETEGSRSIRRLRRSGMVPGIVYGGDGEPISFCVEARTLRNALAAGGAVIDLAIDGDKPTPVVLKDRQRHPVTGETMHIDLIRVRLDVAIHAAVTVVVSGGEESPGVSEGGVLEQLAREINVEALPTAIPDEIEVSVAELQIGDILTLADITVPEGVTILDDLETPVATVSAPRLRTIEEEEAEALETETEVVGEAAEGDGGDDAAEGGDDGGEE